MGTCKAPNNQASYNQKTNAQENHSSTQSHPQASCHQEAPSPYRKEKSRPQKKKDLQTKWSGQMDESFHASKEEPRTEGICCLQKGDCILQRSETNLRCLKENVQILVYKIEKSRKGFGSARAWGQCCVVFSVK